MAVTPHSLSAPVASETSFVDSVDPATNEVVARFQAARTGDLPGIFERAREAQKEWAARPLAERCAALLDRKSVV